MGTVALYDDASEVFKSKQFFLLPVRFLFGLLEVQVGLMVGMFGAVFAGEQSIYGQELYAR